MLQQLGDVLRESGSNAAPCIGSPKIDPFFTHSALSVSLPLAEEGRGAQSPSILKTGFGVPVLFSSKH